MSITTRCPFGCLSLQTELSEFKQISINYFDRIMFKFNNQDKIINELVKKLDHCMNFNYENGYGDQWQCEEDQTDASEEIEDAVEQNNDVIIFSTEPENDKLSTELHNDLEHGYLLTDDRVPAQSDVDLMGEMLSEPHLQAEAREMQEEVTIPQYDEDLELESMGCEPSSATSERDQTKNKRSSIRASGNPNKHQHSSGSEFEAHISTMSVIQIRAKYSTTVDNCGGSRPPKVYKCNLCEKVYDKYQLATHVEMVHFGRRFRCDICKWTLCDKIIVYRHIRDIHRIRLSEISRHLKVVFVNKSSSK